MRTRKIFLYAAAAVMLTGCFGPAALQLRVAPLGEEVPETIEQHLYVLPQTVLKVEVAYQEVKHVPGPFRDYAERYLGVTEVIRSDFSRWQLLDVQVTSYKEPDPGMFYQVNVVEGEYDGKATDQLLERGIILDGTGMVQEGYRDPSLGAGSIRDYVRFEDLGIESNFEERT